MKWLSAADIDNWTNIDPRRAQETLPQLVWKLITATYPHIIDSHFPYGKAVQYSGYDGGLTLEVEESSSFCSGGKSVWEMGTDKDILSKFNGDYKKRTETPNGINASETTFCFVTSRIWNCRNGIVETTEAKNKEGTWKAVRILDANSLEQWLDRCPSVSIWFSDIIGKPYHNAYDIKTYWTRITQGTSPRLTEDYFLLNRESVASQLLRFVNKQAKQVILVAPSSQEALLTLAADLNKTDDQELTNLAEKCIILETPEALHAVDNTGDGVVLIPTFHLDPSTANTFKNILVLPVNQLDPYDLSNKSGSRISIPPRSRHEFCAAIETLGYDSNQAYKIGEDLRCNFPAFLRKISINPLSNTPQWSQKPEIALLIPALLAGKWEENYSGDRAILEKIAGTSYEDFITPIAAKIRNENFPIFGLDKSYACISVLEMWNILFPHLTAKHLDTFEECFNQVFSESNPKYTLSEDKWFMSHVLGKDSKYSDSLKEGMITTLIMLTEQDQAEDMHTFLADISLRCKRMVQNVLSSVSTLNHWRSISSYLPLLTEAAPNVVLARFQNAIQNDEAEFWGLFIDPKDFLTTETFYPNILRALEITMWDSTCASLSLRILLSIAEKQCSYQLANTPLNTLYSVFCLWYPQGIFTLQQRKDLITFILQKHHDIGIQLAKKLLYSGQQTTCGIQFPTWRSVTYKEPHISQPELKEMLNFTAETYLACVQPCYDDWRVILDNMSVFGSAEDLIKLYHENPIATGTDDVILFCQTICLRISKGRKFNKYKAEDLNLLEQFYYEILPDVPKSYAHYFSQHFYGFQPTPYQKDSYNPCQDNSAIFLFRCQKIAELIEHHGIQAVLDIIPNIENKRHYAEVLTSVVLHSEFDWDFIRQVKERDSQTAASIISQLFYNSGLSVISTHADELAPADLGWALSCCLPSHELLDYLESRKDTVCAQIYWECMQPQGISVSDEVMVKRIISGCLEYHRPYSLIDWLAYSPWTDPDSSISILAASLRQYPNTEPNGMSLHSIDNDSILQFFQKLYTSKGVKPEEVFPLELGFITFFDSEFEPKFLIDTVLSNPDLYIELIVAAFSSDSGESHPTHENKVLAKQAWIALTLIQRLPGYDTVSKVVNDTEFAIWVNTVQEKAQNMQYSKSNNCILGQILSHSPMGADGVWPAECVREVFEHSSSEILENNFIIGLRNQRGVHTVTYGKAEDELADQYSAYAEKLQLFFPNTAGIIRRISEEYRAEAKGERARELKGHF